MTKTKPIYRWIYAEEEDYSWRAEERVITQSLDAKRNAFRFFYMVVECFIPVRFLKSSKKTKETQTAKQQPDVGYS